jgi:hypothetical protein
MFPLTSASCKKSMNMLISEKEFNIFMFLKMIQYKLTNQLPSNLTAVQKHRFLKKVTEYDLIQYNSKNCLKDRNTGLIYIDKNDFKHHMDIEYKKVIGGRDKLFWHIKQIYDNITQVDCAKYLNHNLTNIQHTKPPKQKIFRKITSTGKNHRWQCDFITLKPYLRFNYVFTIIDHNTCYAWVYPVFSRDQTILVSKIKPLFIENQPQMLQCDNEFNSNVLKAMLEESNTTLVHSTAYKPNSNGKIERFNQTFKGVLYKLMTDKDTKDWPSLCQEACKIYNNTYHSVLKNTPSHNWNNDVKRVIVNDAKDPPKFKVGDIVAHIRWDTQKEEFKKLYKKNYTDYRYKITYVYPGDIAAYELFNMESNEKLKMKYYNYQLIKKL